MDLRPKVVVHFCKGILWVSYLCLRLRKKTQRSINNVVLFVKCSRIQIFCTDKSFWPYNPPRGIGWSKLPSTSMVSSTPTVSFHSYPVFPFFSVSNPLLFFGREFVVLWVERESLSSLSFSLTLLDLKSGVLVNLILFPTLGFNLYTHHFLLDILLMTLGVGGREQKEGFSYTTECEKFVPGVPEGPIF